MKPERLKYDMIWYDDEIVYTLVPGVGPSYIIAGIIWSDDKIGSWNDWLMWTLSPGLKKSLTVKRFC